MRTSRTRIHSSGKRIRVIPTDIKEWTLVFLWREIEMWLNIEVMI